jgi:hypothetical protein
MLTHRCKSMTAFADLAYASHQHKLVGGTGIELGGAEEKTSGATPTCSGYAEFRSLCSSAEFRREPCTGGVRGNLVATESTNSKLVASSSVATSGIEPGSGTTLAAPACWPSRRGAILAVSEGSTWGMRRRIMTASVGALHLVQGGQGAQGLTYLPHPGMRDPGSWGRHQFVGR